MEQSLTGLVGWQRRNRRKYWALCDEKDGAEVYTPTNVHREFKEWCGY